jgi:hypothetical protein
MQSPLDVVSAGKCSPEGALPGWTIWFWDRLLFVFLFFSLKELVV